MTIYEISKEFLELMQLVEDEDIDAEVIEDTFEALAGEFEAKADGYVAVIKNAEMYAKSLKEEAKRLTERAKKFEAKAERLENILLKNMQLTGHTKFDTEKFSYKVNKGRGSVVIDNEEAVPFDYLIPTTKINTAEINKFLKSLKDGEICDFAHLEFKDSLSVK